VQRGPRVPDKRTPESPDAAEMRRRALGRWDNEGGAAEGGPQTAVPGTQPAKTPDPGAGRPRGARKAKP